MAQLSSVYFLTCSFIICKLIGTFMLVDADMPFEVRRIHGQFVERYESVRVRIEADILKMIPGEVKNEGLCVQRCLIEYHSTHEHERCGAVNYQRSIRACELLRKSPFVMGVTRAVKNAAESDFVFYRIVGEDAGPHLVPIPGGAVSVKYGMRVISTAMIDLFDQRNSITVMGCINECFRHNQKVELTPENMLGCNAVNYHRSYCSLLYYTMYDVVVDRNGNNQQDPREDHEVADAVHIAIFYEPGSFQRALRAKPGPSGTADHADGITATMSSTHLNSK